MAVKIRAVINLMNKTEAVIATISLARSRKEERLLKASLSQLSLLNLPVFVTDGGSPQGFVTWLRRLPNFTVLQAPAKGLLPQIKSSMEEAVKTGRQFVFYTEPDKDAFFKTGLQKMLAAAKGDTGITMASRSARGFASFPLFQQMTEATINRCCEELTGLKADYCYGPFLLHKKLVEQLHNLRQDVGWGWRPFLFAAAHRLGYKIETFEDHFLCPEDQREDDNAERIYRMKQLEQNIRGLVLSAEAGSIR